MAASTKYVQKYTRKPNQVKDEFFVQEKDICFIKQFKDKIENMHQIRISFEAKAEEGQWLVLEGESVDRRNAKNYITAICNPAERKKVQFSSSSCTALTDPATLELVEKRTNAFIRPLKKIAQFEISGTELAVTLALSQIEELAGSVLNEDEDDEFDDDEASQEEGIITISPKMHKATRQLSSVLERALSANSDGVCSVDDYRHTTPAVQRVLLNCLQADDNDDIDDDHLFADGPSSDSSMKGSKLMMFYEDGTDGGSAEVINVDKEKTVQTSPGVSAFAEKMTELNISNAETTSLRTKQQEYLRSFGLSVGFQEKEVDEALQFVDEKTRPSDFLDMLNSLQKHDEDVSHENDSDDDVVILETETIDLINDKNSVFHDTEEAKPDKKECSQNSTEAENGVQNQDQNQSYPSTLPPGYKERLLRDFITEDENCSVEELKRRNAERQKLLRQNFERDQESFGNQSNSPKQTGKKQNSKNKNRKKKNKQQKQNTENQTERSDMHDKQLRMDSGENENQTYSNDVEQTCVLRIWNRDQEPGGSQSNEEPFQTTPKRKHNNNRSTPAQCPQQVAGNNYQRQNVPVHQTAGQWSQPQSPAGRGNFRKPTQVVTPVNVPTVGHRKPAHQDGSKHNEAELRYIVIDGSNVAMTHGNGKFSCKGIKICVDYFRQRGHDKITVFVPQWRQYRPSEDNPILDQNILYELKNEDILVFTPSRKIGRKLVAAYDDRFVLELAEAEDGIIVSNDQYRDLMTEKAAWRNLIEQRLLMYSFVRDRFMPPNDPLGREGPCLDDFLRITKQVPVDPRHWQGINYQNHHQQLQQQQQYNQHYGHFQHGQAYCQQGEGHFQQGQVYLQPNQGHFKPGQSNFVKALNHGLPHTDNNPSFQKQGYGAKPKSYFQRQSDPYQLDDTDGASSKAGQGRGTLKGSVKGQGSFRGKGNRVPRTDEETEELFRELKTIFPDDDQEDKVRNILANHEDERDLTKLTNYLMSVLF